MNNVEMRLLLAMVLSIAVLAVFQYVYGPQIMPTPGANGTNATNATGKAVSGQHSDIKSQEAKRQITSIEKLLPPGTKVSKNGKDVEIDTPLYSAVLTENGGALKHFILKKYKETLEEDSKGVDLVNVEPPLLPLGIKVSGGQEIDLRSYFFKADKYKVTLDEQSSKQKVTFRAELGDGVYLDKIYTFQPNTYLVDLEIRLAGASANKYSIFLYDKPYKAETRYFFSGPSYYGPESGLEEVSLDKPGQIHKFSGPLDWVSYGDNYFMIALLPEIANGPWDLVIAKLNSDGLIETNLTGAVSRANSQEQSHIGGVKVYIGPKEIERLKRVGHNLQEAINFGWFDPIAKPLLYVLNFFYKYLHNYGVAIIVLTIIIKLLFWPLAHKSAQSMKTMQKLQPKLQKLKEKYGDDKERLNKELMQLYRTYKVNPMSGCLPMLLQIPVFFALYKVLLQAIELRHAPFALWINDLSAPDRLMIPGVEIPMLGGIPVLTILMGVSMYVQQKMSPSSLDPTQAKMMQLLPIIFTFMFINFPSGLVLYWLVNNILSIVQQYYVNKFTD